MTASTFLPDAAPQLSPPPKGPVTRPPSRGRFSAVWIIPVVAALLGLWLVWRHYSAKGPTITVRFETAEGIIAGKTPVLCRSVPVGTVAAIELGDDSKTVDIILEVNRNATRLLVEDSQIWVVRARYSSAGISGLNTLVTGNYVELQPGVSKKARRRFIGLENPPATPPGVPGFDSNYRDSRRLGPRPRSFTGDHVAARDPRLGIGDGLRRFQRVFAESKPGCGEQVAFYKLG